MRRFVRRMVSSIRSALRNTISRWASYAASTGSADTLTEPENTEESRKLKAEVERLYTEILSMRPSPALPAGLFCPARTTRPYNQQCALGNGHAGAHCTQRPEERPCGVSQRIRDHGVVHRVVWSEWNERAKCRELTTACQRFFATRNRVNNSKMVTCMRCL